MHPRVKQYLDKVVIRDGEKWIDGNVNLNCLGLYELPFYDININGYFDCIENNLTSLRGSPKSIIGYGLNCSNNKLTSFEGAPKYINNYISAYGNPLKSLKGLDQIDGKIYIDKELDDDYYIQYSLMDKIRFKKEIFRLTYLNTSV